MKASELKVARIGNSRGIRIPAKTLARYHIGDSVIMEERPEGILLRTHGSSVAKLSWSDTATAMAAASEDWSEWDTTSADGLSDLDWTEAPARRVAEPSRKHSPALGRPKAPKGK
jgi:antitoxin component of MazEF toxin-antitoxin module